MNSTIHISFKVTQNLLIKKNKKYNKDYIGLLEGLL